MRRYDETSIYRYILMAFIMKVEKMILSNQFLIRIRICCFLSRGIKRMHQTSVQTSYLIIYCCKSSYFYMCNIFILCNILCTFFNFLPYRRYVTYIYRTYTLRLSSISIKNLRCFNKNLMFFKNILFENNLSCK